MFSKINVKIIKKYNMTKNKFIIYLKKIIMKFVKYIKDKNVRKKNQKVKTSILKNIIASSV